MALGNDPQQQQSQQQQTVQTANNYTPLAQLDPELMDQVNKALDEYRCMKDCEQDALEHKEMYKEFITPVLCVLGEGGGIDLGEGIGKAWMSPGTRSTLNQKKLRGLLLDKLMHVPDIGDILTICFNDATSITTNPFPVIRLAGDKVSEGI